MPGHVYADILEIAQEQHGYITTKDAKEAGIELQRLNYLKHAGLAEHPAYGLYRINAVPVDPYDQYMRAALWHHGTGVISHETALDLYDVCDINPARIHVTIPFEPRLTRKPPDLYVIHKAVLDERDRGVIEDVPVVTLAKAIRESAAMHTRPDLLRQAIDNGRKVGKLRPSVAEELLEDLQLDRAAA